MSITPPPLFYKYLGIQDWLPKLLSGESLKFTSRLDFNDPYDSQPAFQINMNTLAGKAYLHDNLRLRHAPPAERVRIAARIRAQYKKPGIYTGSGIDKYLDNIGLLCLSETWESILMWSHYANHHRGICVGFKSSEDIFQVALPVTYSEALPVIRRPDDSAQVMFEKTFYTKANCWAYEQEWRVLKRKMTEEERDRERIRNADLSPDKLRLVLGQDGPGFYTFSPTAIAEITLGMRVSPTDEQRVIAWVRETGLKASIYKIKPPAGQYALVRKFIR